MSDFIRLTKLNGHSINVKKSAVYALEPGWSSSGDEICLLYVQGGMIMVRETCSEVEYVMSAKVVGD